MGQKRRGRGPKAPPLDRKARFEVGRALREKVSRASQASWEPARDRPDPLTLIEASSLHRVPSLLPIRYGRMSLSPFTYLRGTAAVMASDLSETPSTGLRVQLGGDAHLSNFGVFGTPEGNLVFDVNDFDETLPGPWEWDVKRLAASLVVAAQHNDFSRKKGHRAVLRAVRAYRRAMLGYARETYLDIWHSHLDLDTLSEEADPAAQHEVDEHARKAPRHTSLHAFPKLVRRSGGTYVLRDQPPLIVHYSDDRESETTHGLYERYLHTLPPERRMLLDRYHPVDVVQKVVGVGSVGTLCSVMLLLGDPKPLDPLLLQVKQAGPSALEPYAGASVYGNHAERVVVGQRLMQQASDLCLGWSSIREDDFYVRQLWDFKSTVDPSEMRAKQLAAHGEFCGEALARAHARTGDPVTIAGYLGNGEEFDEAIAEFAHAYALQTRRDHQEFLAAIRSGRITAKVDV
jgi:uncharacterized protein (DUF2252 family)